MAISFVGSLPTVAAANGGNVTLTFSNLRDAAGVQPTLLQNDVVFAVFAWGNTADYTAPTISGWTLLDDKYANGSTNDTNLAVYYKRMGVSPDTSVTATGPGGAANASIGTAFALRGVDTTTAIDVYTSGSHSTTGTGTGAINPVAITPTTAGAWIAVAGALANPIGNTLTNGGDLSATTNHYRTGTSPDTTDISIGVGLKTNWASGAFDPAAWSGGGTRAAGDSWAAVTWAIRPVVPVTHAATGVLTGQIGSVAGSAQHKARHTSTGALTGQGAAVAGGAARTRLHAASGALTGAGAAIAGAARRFRAHASSGALTGAGSLLAGVAARFRAHASAGVLAGPGATLAGSAARSVGGAVHAATGVLIAAGSAIAGVFARGIPPTFDKFTRVASFRRARSRRR